MDFSGVAFGLLRTPRSVGVDMDLYAFLRAQLGL